MSVSTGIAQALTPSTLVGVVAAGIAFALMSADYKSPTTRAVSLALLAAGISFGLGAPIYALGGAQPAWARWLAVSDGLALAGFLEWILRVRRTVPGEKFDTALGDRVLRAGQLCVGIYVGLGLALPGPRNEFFLGSLNGWQALRQPAFWMFAAPILLAVFTGFIASLLLLRRNPDRSERIRILGMMAAAPFLLAGFVLPSSLGALAMVTGELAFLIAAVHYLVLQGERGQFMARFLSPQVEKLVRSRGLKHAMEQRSVEITVVSVDLRGFTAYASAHASRTVIKVLREYYNAVGAVVAEYGGTIKDYAGDGILILLGAPLPVEHHARRAIEMSERVRIAATECVRKWSNKEHRLGVGIGIASGKCTVGIIGSASRWEYTAVGAAVNLASRLCESARDQEILIDARAAKLAKLEQLQPRGSEAFKGFPEPVDVFLLPA